MKELARKKKESVDTIYIIDLPNSPWICPEGNIR